MAAFYFSAWRSAIDHLLALRVANQDHIGVVVTANYGQLLAIKRPVKVPDAFGGEIGNVPAFGTVERLQPQIVDTLVAGGVNHGFAIMAEAYQPEPEALKFK